MRQIVLFDLSHSCYDKKQGNYTIVGVNFVVLLDGDSYGIGY